MYVPCLVATTRKIQIGPNITWYYNKIIHIYTNAESVLNSGRSNIYLYNGSIFINLATIFIIKRHPLRKIW